MPDAIESKTFRKAARRNCIKYLGIPIYMSSIPELRKLNLPTFRAQSPDGAVSQLFSTLVNMGTQVERIRKGLRMADSKPVPGVSYNELSEMSMSLSGDVYFENARQYNEFTATIQKIAKNYGWIENTSGTLGTAVYHPARSDFTNSDPVQAAVKGLVLGAASEMMDAATLLASGSVSEGSKAEEKYFAARDRYEGGSIFDMAALQYYANTPQTVQNQWATGMGSDTVPTLMIEDEPAFKANIAYMPTSVSITPGAYVNDSSGMYPTKCAISISMANPLGGLFANFSVAKEDKAGAGDAGKSLIPAAYLQGQNPY